MTKLFFERTSALCFALALGFAGTLGCTDDGSEGTDEVGDGDGDGDETTGDGDETTGDGDGEALSYDADIQPIWDTNCVNACHTDGGSAMFLDLGPGSHGNIVGVASTQGPGLTIVLAGNSAESYLIAKLRGTQLDMGGTGGQMPATGDALPEATIKLIEDWIDEGAAP
jgi:hypothetical protein